jgi:hypothetical protein
MDEEERISRFCTAYAMAQRVLDMAAEQPAHTGMARDEARRQLAIAFELFPATVKAKIARLNEVAATVKLTPVVEQSRTTESLLENGQTILQSCDDVVTAVLKT